MVGVPYSGKKQENISGLDRPFAVNSVVKNPPSGGNINNLKLTQNPTGCNLRCVGSGVLTRVGRVFGPCWYVGVACVVTVNLPPKSFFVDWKVTGKVLAKY